VNFLHSIPRMWPKSVKVEAKHVVEPVTIYLDVPYSVLAQGLFNILISSYYLSFIVEGLY
jgi:uncharacterized membrane protein YvlD (DUF360 family)